MTSGWITSTIDRFNRAPGSAHAGETASARIKQQAVRLVCVLASIFWLIPLATSEAWSKQIYKVGLSSVFLASTSDRLALSREGKLLAVATPDGTVHVWDWKRATLLHSRKIGQRETWDLFFIDNDRRLVASFQEGIQQRLVVWELDTGEVVDHGLIDSLSQTHGFEPDGTIAIVDGLDIRYVSADGTLTDRRLKLHSFGIYLSAEAPWILTQTTKSDGLNVLDGAGKQVGTVNPGFEIADASISKDGRVLAVQPYEALKGTAFELYDVATGKKLQAFSLEGSESASHRLRFSPDGTKVLTFSTGGELKLRSVKTGKTLRQFSGHRAGIVGAGFLSGGKLVVASSLDGTTRIWSARDGKEIATMIALDEPSDQPSFFVLRSDGRFVERGPARIDIVNPLPDGSDGSPISGEDRDRLKLEEMVLQDW